MTDNGTPNKLIIIGSGPAGLTAAIYAARSQLHPLVIDGMQPGGQLTTTSDVENFPGFARGISGPELMNIMREQAERFGTEFEFDEVTEVDLSKRPFAITLSGGDVYRADAVIIASGASARYLGLESERRLIGKGVSACATCDGFFFKGKEIAVVGGGDSALEEAIYLTHFASKVSVIHRRDALRGSLIMQKRALTNEKIVFVWNSVVEDVLANPETGKVGGLRLKNVKDGGITEYPVEGLFVAIGHDPNTKVFAGQLDMDQKGYIVTHDGTKTSVPGVFAAGDVQDHVYRQAITAAGSGCMAAIDAERFLGEE